MCCSSATRSTSARCSRASCTRQSATRPPRVPMAADIRGDVEVAGGAVSAPGASPSDNSTKFAIRSAGLTKRFRGGQVAVDHVDLAVPEGAVYGFLGPNGSGKTTTIRMLLGLAYPTSGTAELLGIPMPGGT